MYDTLSYIHLSTIIPAFIVGTYLMFRRKGTSIHMFLGKCYMLLMLFSSSLTLFMSAKVGPSILGHFGYIHLLSVFTIYCVPNAYIASRSGNTKKHRNYMIGLYFGGLIVAGGFALLPGRMLRDLLIG
ncbi:MAG TPA: DUF2306 domain-containing protein [Candidatus Thioglobus sp.]|jgi:uncharacterized membrane protein|nr:DUF2306 domain-containing protein [Candidatus Thioglobus sp.]HIL43339.1 DUF2306 domain-containing protein [Gammaproteobacteria bacterium]